MKSFAQTHWRTFEELTRELFKFEFGLSNNQISITSMSHDGGKDVSIDMSSPTQILPTPNIKIWVETKLRNNYKEKIGLNNIAGNVVIASNNNVRSIYFVTSCFFAPQTIKELFISSLKNGLDIFLIDGGNLRKLIETHKESIPEYLHLFTDNLLSRLPLKPQKEIQNLHFEIERGNPFEVSGYSNAFKSERKIERRVVDIKSVKLAATDKVFKLNEIKFKPILKDDEITNNPEYCIHGKDRLLLKEDVIHSMLHSETVILSGNLGQGKTFFSNHIVRELYKKEFHVIFIDIEEDLSILALTKKLVLNSVGVEYFKFIEHDDLLIDHFVSHFGIERFIAEQLINLIRHDGFSGELPVDFCFNLLSHLLGNISERKKLAIIVDNLHKSSSDLFSFLKNLFVHLGEQQIAILSLASTFTDNIESIEWMKKMRSIISNNKMMYYELPDLSQNDIEIYAKSLVPGANDNVINFITTNSLSSPFYVKLFIDFLKKHKHIRSKNNKYWWLHDSALLFEKESIRINNIDSLVSSFVRSKIENESVKKLSIYVYLFNNYLNPNLISNILKIDIPQIVDNPLFQVSYDENSHIIISFYHDLYFNNFSKALLNSTKILNYYSAEIINTIKIEDLSIEGNLYEHIGLFDKAHECYHAYAQNLPKSDSFKSMLYYEKSINVFYNSIRNNTYKELESVSCQADAIFLLLDKYKKYNFLNHRKAPELFLLLKKFTDFKELDDVRELRYQSFVIHKLTKEEDFNSAHQILKNVFKQVNSSTKYPQYLVNDIVIQFGLNLKHIGKKKESLEFFNKAFEKWSSDQIMYEQYSNIAAFHLVNNPKKALECYDYMRVNLNGENKVHLMIDFGMVYFYLGELERAKEELDKSVIIARKKINLAEEARAENIIGLILWNNGNNILAEKYFELALSNAELANNHRWIWRIRTNLAQVALLNKSIEKAYNISWSVIDHLVKTKSSLLWEIKNNKNSRRFASLKAVVNLLFIMKKNDDIRTIQNNLGSSELDNFVRSLYKNKKIEFDNDANIFGNWYYILG